MEDDMDELIKEFHEKQECKILLQKLWHKYSQLITELDEILDDSPVFEEPYKTIGELTVDTPEMSKFRNRLVKCGVIINV